MSALPATQPAPRRFVRMFQPRFADLVESGAKLQTIRPTPARMPQVGDIIDCRKWAGVPYRSPKVEILTVPIVEVTPCFIVDHISFGGSGRRDLWGQQELDAFADADGFTDWDEMREWFDDNHRLPFLGILIRWERPYHDHRR